MIKQGLLLKWVIVILLGLGGATAMAYYANPGHSIFKYPRSIYEYYFENYFKKPKAPEIVDQYVEGGCGARVHWVDNALDEDGVRFYRRVVGQPNFVAIQITGPHAGIPGSFDDDSQDNLPVGTYEYRVSVFNEYGQTFSNISGPVVIVNAICGDGPLLIGPLNPIITDYEVVKDTCDVQIWFDDHSLDEDGLRVYRSSWVDNEALIAELGPHAGVPGEFIDQDLPPGHYQYQISVFNANGEAFSNVTDDIEITEAMCKQSNANPAAILVITPTATLVSTATPTPVAKAQACIWKAAINVFVRTGPSASAYPDITALEAGETRPVIGQSEDEFFWVLEVEPRVNGYVSKLAKFGRVTGVCDVPTLPDPEPPPPALQCKDGVDNDGDGQIDMVDRECRNPDDNSE